MVTGHASLLQRSRPSPATLTRIGWGLSALFALFMLGASALPKLAGMAVAQDTMTALGWPAAPLLLIGGLELGLTLLFLIPQTALLGAVLMMGLLGGAMVTQVRAGSPLFSHILFAAYLGAVMWGALWCRMPALRTLFPLGR